MKGQKMGNVTIRIHFRSADETIEDGLLDFGLSDFGGILPAVGDRILNPGVLQGRDRYDPLNREIWTVIGRVFNPRDEAEYIALVVDMRPPRPDEYCFIAGG